MELLVENVSKSYHRVRAVKQVSFQVKSGEIMALVGPSGCGKTTLLRIIAGLVVPDTGSVKINNRDITTLAPHLRPTATVFQNYALFPHLNVWDNVAYGLKARWLPAREVRERVGNALALMRISDLGKRKTNELSGGQQQRVALARSVVINPQVLLFDEPLSSLDARLRVEMREEIKKLQQETGITSVYVTHDQEEALAIAHQVAVMRDGLFEQVGTPEEIYHMPKTPFVAGFIGWGNLLSGHLEHSSAKTAVSILGHKILLDQFPSASSRQNGRVTAFFRPEKVVPDPNGAFSGTIRQKTFLGSSIRYLIKPDTADDRELYMDLPTNLPQFTAGEKVRFGIVANGIRLFPEEHTEEVPESPGLTRRSG